MWTRIGNRKTVGHFPSNGVFQPFRTESMDLVQLAAVFSRTNQTTRRQTSFSNMVHTMILASGFLFLSMLEPEQEPVSFMGSNTEKNVQWDQRHRRPMLSRQ
ncbi:hypothetical protein V6N13_113388 [Hibiscus sabdariffa]|uniref:Uncharacterized protein n=1 Tax=Hibiscus sabdariffa TaxID=183260 RepID=A0ABR2CW92_9ROSI